MKPEPPSGEGALRSKFMLIFRGGIPLYLAGLLLIPGEGSEQSIAGALVESVRSGSR